MFRDHRQRHAQRRPGSENDRPRGHRDAGFGEQRAGDHCLGDGRRRRASTQGLDERPDRAEGQADTSRVLRHQRIEEATLGDRSPQSGDARPALRGTHLRG